MCRGGGWGGSKVTNDTLPLPKINEFTTTNNTKEQNSRKNPVYEKKGGQKGPPHTPTLALDIQLPPSQAPPQPKPTEVGGAE